MTRSLLIALACISVALLSTVPVNAERFLRGDEAAFAVKGITPQELAERPVVNYHPPDKFPDYSAGTSLQFETSVTRDEWVVGDRLNLIFEAGRSGYVSIIDYAPDGVARVVLRNRRATRGFRYSFSAEVSEPAGDDYLRAVLSSIPLGYASFKTLGEYPFAPDPRVNNLIRERWLVLTVRASVFRRYPYDYVDDDPFYRWPRTWYSTGQDERYLYVQPYRDAILSRGLTVRTDARVFSDFTELGPAQYWLVEPGGDLEISFEVGDLPRERPELYLLLYMSVDEAAGGWIFGESEGSSLRIRCNGATVADDYAPRYLQFYDDGPPEVFAFDDYMRYGSNRVVLRVNPFADRGVRIRRVEIRARLTALDLDGRLFTNDEEWW